MFRKFSDVDDEDEAGMGPLDAFNARFDRELEDTVPVRLHGPLTRSSLKPRLLFPTDEQIAAKEKRESQGKKPEVTDDEEAVTDIEDGRSRQVSAPASQVDQLMSRSGSPKFGSSHVERSHQVSTPVNQIDQLTSSPRSPKTGMVSPRMTNRMMRSAEKGFAATRASNARKTVTAKPSVPFVLGTIGMAQQDGTPPDSGSGSNIRSRGKKGTPFRDWRRVKHQSTGQGQKRGGDVPQSGTETKRQRRGSASRAS